MTKRINTSGETEVAFGFDTEKKQPFMRISTSESDYVEISADDASWIQEQIQWFLNLHSENGKADEKEENDSDNEPHLTYIETARMESIEEVEAWEKKENACVLYSNAGGILELKAAKTYSLDEYGNPVEGTETECVGIAMCDDALEEELILIFSSKSEIRKMRDYLNRHLEDWKK